MNKKEEKDRKEMSQEERDVLKVMSEVLGGRRTQSEAARLLDRSVRQIRRIQRRLEREGDGGVIHKLRGRKSNARRPEEERKEALKLYRTDYHDFGPTLTAEKLGEHGIEISVETLRMWLIEEGLWTRKRRRSKHRSRRPRRACLGELLQADGSQHDWTEGRGEDMVLLAMIDDATGRIRARFYPAETTEAYMDLLTRYLRAHGRPLAVYTDRDSIFEPQRQEDREAGTTQFERALRELDIEWIAAYSPQAKGRVERLFGTLQDRWVKELRLAGVRTIAEANALVDTRLVPEFNRRFSVRAASPNDAHRAVGTGICLEAILSVQSVRRVSNDYTVRFQNEHYQLLPPAVAGLRGGHVVIERRLDGSTHIRFRGRYLDYATISEGRWPAGPAGSDRGRQGPDTRRRTVDDEARPDVPRWRPGPDHPWRRRLM